jgi:MATE family multidrug resistance protein
MAPQHAETKNPADDNEGPLPSFREAVSVVLRFGLGVVANSLLSFGVNRTYGMALVGRTYTPRDISVAGVGITIYSVAGVSVAIGFSCGVDTLCSQANGRNPKSNEAGNWLKLAAVLTLLLLLPTIILFAFFAEPLLGFLFAADMAADIASFLRYSIPLMIMQSTSILLGRGFQATRRSDVPLYTSTSASVVFCIVALATIPFRGIHWYPLSLAIANAWSIVSIFFYSHVIDDTSKHENLIVKTNWKFWTAEFWNDGAITLPRAREYSRIGFASAMAIASEWIAIETLVLIGSQLPAHELAGLQLAWITISLFFTAPLSFSVASSAFAGNHLGANEPRHAEYLATICQVCNIGATLLISGLLAAFALQWHSLFTLDPDVLTVLMKSTAAVIIFFNFHAQHIAIQGIFRGVGWQSYCAVAVGVSLWLVGVPCCYLVGLKRWAFADSDGPTRILLGFCAGFALEIAILLYGLRLLPWRELALEASKHKWQLEHETLDQPKQRRGGDNPAAVAA